LYPYLYLADLKVEPDTFSISILELEILSMGGFLSPYQTRVYDIPERGFWCTIRDTRS